MRYLFLSFIFMCNFFKLEAQVLQRDWVSYYAGQLTSVSDIIYEPVCDCIYITGYTADSVGIATPGAHKENFTYSLAPSFMLDLNLWKSDIFLAKFDRNGNRIWGTYIGGEEEEKIVRIATDSEGNIYLTGTTKSSDGIASPGAFIDTKPLDWCLASYLMKFNADGVRQWGTYYDVNALDSNIYNGAICIDTDDNIYIGGRAMPSSIGIATLGTFQPFFGGGEIDGYVAKFSSSGDRIWGTYIGGSAYDFISSLTYSNDGYLYGVGTTSSTTGIATTGTFQSEMLGNNGGFVIKLNPLDGQRIWGTYLSTTDSSQINPLSIKSDVDGNVYVSGKSSYYIYGIETIEDVATPGTHSTDRNDHFIMKLNSSGNRVWGTYYGGENYENESVNFAGGGVTTFLKNLLISKNGQRLYVNGYTESSIGIADDCSYITTSGERRGYIGAFNTLNGQRLWGSYYDAEINNIAINDIDDQKPIEIYLGSRTHIDGLTTVGAHKYSKTGLWTSGLIGKLLVQCPLDTFSLQYEWPMLLATEDANSYTWFHNGIEVASSDAHTFNPGADTTGYYYAIAEKCGCTYTSDTFYFDATSIDVWGEWADITLYPNPVQEILTLDFCKGIVVSENMPIEIIDMYGRVVITHLLSKGKHQKIQISTTSLMAGVYILRVSNQSFVFTKR